MMQATNTPQHYPVVSQVEDFVSLVKCPICTKVLQNPIELRCSHIFCAHCIERFASGRNYTCPVCSKNVVKQSARPAHETDGAVTFVQNILKQLQAASIQQQATEEKLNPQIGDKQEKTSPKKLRVKPKVAATQNRNASASNAKSKVKPPEVKQKKLSPKNKKDTTHSPEKGKTKSDHKGTATTEAAHPPIVEPYKEHVLRWLHNSQNIFQRTSQTQQNASASPGSSKVAHLPKNLQSVSQRASKRRSLPPRQAVEQNYGRNYRSLDSLTNISTCRTNKSNLIKSKMLRIEKTKVDTKIFDSPVNDTELEESRIEDIDSNPLISKSGICKEIEEQCLQNIEQNLECKKSTRKRKQEEKKSDKVGASQQKPDWMRINKFAKMADKIDGVPKKLKVVTTKNDARKLNTSGALKVDIKRKMNESIPDKSQNKSVDNDTNIEKIDKEKNVEKSDDNLENNEVNEEKLEAKQEKIAEHDKNNKTKERMDLSENVILDSQFSTTMPSQQVYPSKASEANQNMKSLRGKLNSNVRTILMENIMKEFEYSKWPTSSSQGTNTLVIDCTEKFRNKTTSPKNRERTTSMAPMNQPQQNGDNAEEDMFIANTQKLNDADAFMEATQQMPEISNVTLHNKCEQFLMQYSELTQRLTCFFRMDSCHDGDESYEKLSLIHRHLQVLQPKFSNMSLILSNNDTNLQEQDIATHQYTQTDAIDELKVDVSVQTSPFKSSQKKKTQSPVMCNEHTQTSQRVICLEKSPIVYTDNIPNVADVQQSKQNSQKCDEDIAMKNTLDFVDFDTEMVMKNINLEKSHLHSQRKRETFTMALNTEQMALTEFISKTQLLDEPVSEKSQLHVKDKSQVSSNGSSNKQGSVRTTNEKKTRRKLYDSPKSPTSPKSPKSPRYPKSPKSDVSIPIAKGGQNKRVKPLAISDSEEDEQNAICKDLRRDDISVCFDSESQREFFNSPNADKYLDEVWNRLEIDTSTKTKTALTHDVDAQALQAEIKKNTREIIEKCAEMISNAGQIDASHKHKQSSGRTPIASQKKVKASQKTKTVPNHDLKSVESVCDLLTDSIFNDDDLFENYKTPSPCSSSRDKPRSTLHNVHSDLIYKDSTTSILTNILDEQPAEPNPPDVPPITILQDIQVVKTNVRKKSESEDDLIFSTPEGTPTKMPHKQTIYEDEVLVPPADFQDPPPPPKSAKENKSPLMKLSSSTPRASQRRSQIWNVNQNILALSPINRTPSRVRFNMPTAASQSSALRTNKSPAGSAHLRRVTSTPSTNSTNLKSTPPPFRHNHNPPLFTHVNVVRKGPILSQQRPQPLNIQCGVGDVCDEDDLFVPRSSKPQAVIACSRLGKAEMIAINALAKRGLVRYSTAYDESVTHMVVAATDSNCAKDHTIKYVRAVAAGIWVVNFNWVQDSLAQNKLLSEEFYEVYDVTGSDGPKQSRLYRTTKPLFAGFKVYVAPPFQLITPTEIENIIRSLGGVTVTSPEALLPKDGYICLIISETGPTQDDDLYTNYQEWVDKLRVAPVEFEWLTRCIGAYKLNSLRRFALCTDESLCELGYPQNLLENVTCSFTQNE